MKESIAKFLSSKSEQIAELSGNYPDSKSLKIDFTELERYDSKITDKLMDEPDDTIAIFNQLLREIAEVYDKRKKPPEKIENPTLYTRFFNLPKEGGYSIPVRDINSDYIDKLIAVDGIVNKISDVLPKVSVGAFICNNPNCKQIMMEPQNKRFIQSPLKCSNCGKHDFRFDIDRSVFIDTQKLEIQESLELLKGGEQARRIEIWCEEDLTNIVTAGDKITVTGVLRLKPPKRGSFEGSAVYYKFIEANHIEPIEREFEEIEITKKEEKQIKKLASDPGIYDMVIDSIAPGIYGYREVKEAIALQLFGGRVGKKMPDGTSIRSDMHILLIGDPGVAKSRILQYVDQIAPKSLYVTGKGATGAGLTATAERDEFEEGAWTLKAGALVLAGGGIAAIDEFDKMDKEDRSAMHEAMEQQTISVAKAGIVAKFKANTSVLAASNPKFGRFDTYKPLGEQFDIPPTLLSRFDLIFPIRDVLDKELDRKIAEHMLKIHKTEKEVKELEPPVPAELFRKYIAYSRLHMRPILTDDAAEKLKEYYIKLRSIGKGSTAAATPRQLEALVRLSEASAKIRLSDSVTISDAERAIRLTDFVLKEIAYDESTGVFDIDRVVTEYPKSIRDKIRVVEDIVRELVGENEKGEALLGDILTKAEEKELDRFEAERMLNELKKKGEIYEPRTGRYKITEM